jgi:HEPN domain-containing protein
VLEAAKLSDYAVEARYPGVSEPVSQEEYVEALRLAEDVMRWVEDLMRVDK